MGEARVATAGQVNGQLGNIETKLEKLTVAIDLLEDSIGSILRPDDEVEAAAGVPQETLVLHAEHLRAIAHRIDKAGSQIQRINSRLEL